MNFGLYEHTIVAAILILLVTRKTRFFYLSLILVAISQWTLIDYLKNKIKESEIECAKYSISVLGRIIEVCVNVKRNNLGD